LNGETTTGATWAKITGKLDLLTLGMFTGPARYVPADRRAHQDPARPARQAHDRAPEEDHRSCPGSPLTSSDTVG